MASRRPRNCNEYNLSLLVISILARVKTPFKGYFAGSIQCPYQRATRLYVRSSLMAHIAAGACAKSLLSMQAETGS